MTTALIYDPIFLEHLTPENHPDRPERLKKAVDVLQALNWLEREGLVQLAPRAATEDELATVHDREYIQKVKAAAHKVAREQDSGDCAPGGETECLSHLLPFSARVWGQEKESTQQQGKPAGLLRATTMQARPGGTGLCRVPIYRARSAGEGHGKQSV